MKAVGVDRFMLAAESLPMPFYQEFAPPRDLAEFVACSWARVVRSGTGTSEPILPDGCADIMVFDDEAPRVAGPDAVTRRTVLWNGTVIVGIRLRPGACRAVFGCSAAEIVNGGAWLRELVPGAGELHRRLNGAETLSGRVAVLEGWVRAALAGATPNDRAVIAACRLLGAGSKRDVGDVARQLGWNARMIHRQFVAACGYSPKHFQRIMHIQQVLARGRAARRATRRPCSRRRLCRSGAHDPRFPQHHGFYARRLSRKPYLSWMERLDQ